ncbi:tautomerase family protein [Nevskia soli]|uniref:tautomerase family protein n=1 Tax=Nevskia soli TaxID=418856 RepID=UPI0004A6F24D|nr:tautomerase family protein [Nevskia soli]
MPSTLISIRRQRSVEERRAMVEAVHEVLARVLKAPDHDRTVRLQTFAAEEFAVGPQVGENYTVVEISLYPGRTLAVKRELYQALVQALGAFGVPPQETKFILNEVAPDNWGLRGGIPGSEVSAPVKKLEV